MSDGCKHCICRGDIGRCIETPCFQHESWLALHRAEEIKRLKEKLRIIQEIIDANKIEMVSEELCQGRSNL